MASIIFFFYAEAMSPMAASPSSCDHQEDWGEEMMELNKDLERMIEDVENISVQLTWMAYDMVVQRTSPDLGDSIRRLEEEFLRCRAVICDSPGEQEPNQGQGKDQGMG
ncbi:synaptonemal complex central element protein 3 isoform X1 [Oncorhynchus nerka]|uniref:synaptonemal complex central element protein 3 isoform X1 n=2 Tax=Oncorhynchus nerka TaxID=8023 RepID=UPI0031B80F72